MSRRRHSLWIALAASLALPCPAAPRPAAETGKGNDYPTLDRVKYVMQCMNEHGGENYNNLYHCVCAIDKLAGLMTYQDYVEALTFANNIEVPGERGAEFRDPPRSREMRDKLKAALKETESCFPAKPEAPAGK